MFSKKQKPNQGAVGEGKESAWGQRKKQKQEALAPISGLILGKPEDLSKLQLNLCVKTTLGLVLT